MTDDVKPEVIKKTQDLLGKYFKKPPLTEKLLKKPPFRFLHDIISAVIKTTGFLDGLFTEEELVSENIKEKEAKLAYLSKLIDVVKLISGANLSVRPSKIISGQEATKTNELLQVIGKCLDKKVSSVEAIEHYKKNVEKKSKSSSKSKSSNKEESSRKAAGKQSSQTKKGIEKESSSSEHKKRSSSTGKLSSKDGESHNSKEKTDSAPGDNVHGQEQDNKKKNETIEIPPAEPVHEKRPSTPQKKRHSSSAKVKESASSSTITSDIEQPSSGNLGKVKEEHGRRRESASRTKQPLVDSGIEDNQLQNSSESLTSDTRAINNVVTANDNVELGIDGHTGKENILAVETTQIQVEKTESQVHQSELSKSPQEIVHSSVPQQRPRTSLRPPTARPISARPAAPRMRAKADLIVNEEIITPMGNINVIVESSDLKDEDDADDMVVMESKAKIDSVDTSGNYKMDDQLTQEHGHLVAQILETQRELVNTDNVDVLPKKVDIAWETGSKRDREAMMKEIDRLRGTIQTLTRATNPLGKLLDYIQEDVEMMQKELLDWRNQYNQLSEQLEKEQLQTQELIEPMKETLTDIDRNMKDQLDKICQAKARIIKNDQKIKRLLSGNP